MSVEHVAKAQRPEHAARGAGNRAGAAIKGRERGGIEILRVNDDAGHLVAGQGQGQRGAHKAATNDDHIRIHAPALAQASDSPKRDMMSCRIHAPAGTGFSLTATAA